MAPFFENDEFFDELISYARAVARRRGLATLDRLSFDLGIGYALLTGKVKDHFTDLHYPNEAVLFAYAQSNYCPLVDLSPSLEAISLDESFADSFVAKHVKQRSTLHTLLKDVLFELNATLDGLSVGSLVTEFSIRQNEPFYFSIIVGAGREDFGLFMPILSVDVNFSSEDKSIYNRIRRFQEEVQVPNSVTR